MTMRTLSKRTHIPSPSQDGMHWAKFWNRKERAESLSEKHITVVSVLSTPRLLPLTYALTIGERTGTDTMLPKDLTSAGTPRASIATASAAED